MAIRRGLGFWEVFCLASGLFVPPGMGDHQRNYRLRAMMAVAHIVQDREFLRRWVDAGDDENLKDIALLSSRKRDRHHHA